MLRPGKSSGTDPAAGSSLNESRMAEGLMFAGPLCDVAGSSTGLPHREPFDVTAAYDFVVYMTEFRGR